MFSWSKIQPALKKALTLNLAPASEDAFPELPTVLLWFRFCLAVIYGLYAGVNLFPSAVVLIQALNLIAFVPTVYCKFYLGVPAEVYPTQVVFSGLPNALALVLLIWIYCFTAAAEPQEAQLAALLLSSGGNEMMDGEGADVLGEAAAAATEEPEF